MAPADMAPGKRLGRPYHRFISLPRSGGPLLLQPRIISRRRRNGRRRGTRRHYQRKAAESDSGGDGSICVKSFHVIPPAPARQVSASPPMRHSRLIVAISTQVSVTDDRRVFKRKTENT
jgi:hypothetical protein